MYSRDQELAERRDFRYFHDLKLHFEQITVFPAVLTVASLIMREPLHGATIESLEAERALSLSQWSGSTRSSRPKCNAEGLFLARFEIRQRFVEIFMKQRQDAEIAVDYGRLHDTEPLDSKSCSQLLPADQIKIPAASARIP